MFQEDSKSDKNGPVPFKKMKVQGDGSTIEVKRGVSCILESVRELIYAMKMLREAPCSRRRYIQHALPLRCSMFLSVHTFGCWLSRHLVVRRALRPVSRGPCVLLNAPRAFLEAAREAWRAYPWCIVVIEMFSFSSVPA